jgi:CRISPR-associated endoribonuclease Cas6
LRKIKIPMRLKLKLTCRPNGILSFNYHYALQAVIYKILQRADPNFSQWLHEKGYALSGHKRFKLFTFSDLYGFYKPNFQEQTLQFQTTSVEWLISFCVDTAMEKFITGLFQSQELTVATPKGRIDFTIDSLEIMDSCVFSETMRFRAVMPICISEQQEGRAQPKYLAPDEQNYEALFLSNLANKYHAANACQVTEYPSVLKVKILSEPRKRGMETHKATLSRPIKVIGYTYDFEITAPIEWLKVGYAAGFGKSSSAGFGMCGIL